MEKTTSYAIRESMKQFQERFGRFVQQQQKDMRHIEEAHNVSFNQGQERIQELERQLESLRGVLHKQTLSAEKEKQRLRDLEEAVEKDQQKEKQLPVDVHKVIEDQKAADKKATETAAETQSIRKDTMEQQSDLSKAILFYKTRLGMEFECPDGQLKVIFKYLDRRSPHRLFSFMVQVDQNNKYILKDCSPALEQDKLDAMISRVNKDNDFSFLVQSMRRAFKEHAATPGAAAKAAMAASSTTTPARPQPPAMAATVVADEKHVDAMTEVVPPTLCTPKKAHLDVLDAASTYTGRSARTPAPSHPVRDLINTRRYPKTSPRRRRRPNNDNTRRFARTPSRPKTPVSFFTSPR